MLYYMWESQTRIRQKLNVSMPRHLNLLGSSLCNEVARLVLYRVLLQWKSNFKTSIIGGNVQTKLPVSVTGALNNLPSYLQNIKEVENVY
jgi:hypothetical protein